MSELKHYGVVGMKWGVRRYQNRDGTLTEAGRKRYERDITDNKAKKKENRIEIDGPDPKRWVKEDLSNAENATREAKNITRDVESLIRDMPTKKKERLDLSKMADNELREKINREQLERQYNQLFNEIEPTKVEKGKNKAMEVLRVSGTVLSIAASAVTIARNITQMTSAGKQSKPNKLMPLKTDTKVTRNVKNDYNVLSDKEFMSKYKASKKVYAKRVEKWGDPYKYRRDNPNFAMKMGKKLLDLR